MATTYELLLLSSLSAEEQHPLYTARQTTLEQQGWQLLSSSDGVISKKNGYQGIAYLKPPLPNQKPEVAIVHQGPIFDKVADLIIDIAIAKNARPAILNDAISFLDHLLPQMTKLIQMRSDVLDHPMIEITHTGFSLGGYLAGACAMLSKPLNSQAVTFDAPGIGSLQIYNVKNAKNIINYLTSPNLVNTCNEHIGEVRQFVFWKQENDVKEDICFNAEIADLAYELPPASLKKEVVELNEWVQKNKVQNEKRKWAKIGQQEINDSLASHDLNKMIELAKQNASVISVYQWPVANITFNYATTASTSAL